VRSSGFHHLDIVVSSIERSLAFYRDLLGPLGWQGLGEVEGERGETIHYLSNPGSSLGLRQATTPSEAPSRGVVDERGEWLRAHDVEIESGPESYGYLPGYYAVFFYDPDGLKLELVHVPAHAA